MTTQGASRYVFTPHDNMPSYFTIDVRSIDYDFINKDNHVKVDVNWRSEVDENLKMINKGQANAQQKDFMMMLKKLWEKFCNFEKKLSRPYVIESALTQIKERSLDFYNFLIAPSVA